MRLYHWGRLRRCFLVDPLIVVLNFVIIDSFSSPKIVFLRNSLFIYLERRLVIIDILPYFSPKEFKKLKCTACPFFLSFFIVAADWGLGFAVFDNSRVLLCGFHSTSSLIASWSNFAGYVSSATVFSCYSSSANRFAFYPSSSTSFAFHSSSATVTYWPRLSCQNRKCTCVNNRCIQPRNIRI